MAWTTPLELSGSAKTLRLTNYHNQRFMKGPVQMRLTDVTFDNGFRFGHVGIDFEFRNNSGVAVASGRLYREWGVPAPFTSLGYISPGTITRATIRWSYVHGPNGSVGNVEWWYKFKGEVRWDPAF